jgi:hypothetical protein
MVRETRFSFEDGMNVDFPRARDAFDEDDDALDECFGSDPLPARTLHRSRRDDSRTRPEAHRADRRHLAGADWMTPAPGSDDPAPGSGGEAERVRQEKPGDGRGEVTPPRDQSARP